MCVWQCKFCFSAALYCDLVVSCLLQLCEYVDRLGTFCLQIIGRSSAPLFVKIKYLYCSTQLNCNFSKKNSVTSAVYMVHFF